MNNLLKYSYPLLWITILIIIYFLVMQFKEQRCNVQQLPTPEFQAVKQALENHRKEYQILKTANDSLQKKTDSLINVSNSIKSNLKKSYEKHLENLRAIENLSDSSRYQHIGEMLLENESRSRQPFTFDYQ